jgi:hypothetical protein
VYTSAPRTGSPGAGFRTRLLARSVAGEGGRLVNDSMEKGQGRLGDRDDDVA